jgi:hypothetical protein
MEVRGFSQAILEIVEGIKYGEASWKSELG